MFYDNFERVCKERKSNPSRACLDAGMKVNRPANWKATGALPKQDELERLAKVLKCEVADFFRSETAPPKFHTVYDALAYQSCKDDEAYKSALERMTPPETEVDDDEEECLVYKGNIYYPDTDEYYVVALMTTLGRRQRHEFMDLVYDFADERGLDDEEGLQ